MFSYPPHVIVLLGPTASGKTELAIEIAEYFKLVYTISIQGKFISLWILEQPNHQRINKKK